MRYLKTIVGYKEKASPYKISYALCCTNTQLCVHCVSLGVEACHEGSQGGFIEC